MRFLFAKPRSLLSFGRPCCGVMRGIATATTQQSALGRPEGSCAIPLVADKQQVHHSPSIISHPVLQAVLCT